jgi:hypothetical protein
MRHSPFKSKMEASKAKPLGCGHWPPSQLPASLRALLVFFFSRSEFDRERSRCAHGRRTRSRGSHFRIHESTGAGLVVAALGSRLGSSPRRVSQVVAALGARAGSRLSTGRVSPGSRRVSAFSHAAPELVFCLHGFVWVGVRGDALLRPRQAARGSDLCLCLGSW